MKQVLAVMDVVAPSSEASAPRYYAARKALRAAIEQAQEPVAWVYPEGLEALKSGRPWTAYGSNGDGRIPLYLNDAVARKWQGLTNEEREQFRQWAHPDIIEAIELRLQERNT